MELHPEVKNKAAKLIQTTCTQPILYKNILELGNDDLDFDWDNLFDSSNEYMKFYAF